MKLLTLTAAALLAASTASADVKITIRDGLVTIVATDATVRQIIAEWARVGDAKVINGDRIPGGPISLELTNVPEGQALDTLLRSVAGYLAAPRATLASDLSLFDRIVVMPTSSAPRAPVATAPVFQPPQFQQPQFQQQPALQDDDPEDERPQANPATAAPNPRGPVFNAFPPPQVVNPQTGAPATQLPQVQAPVQSVQQPVPPPPAAYPTNPYGGVAVPGMMVPTPQAPNQPGQIGAPTPAGQTRRPGGIEH